MSEPLFFTAMRRMQEEAHARRLGRAFFEGAATQPDQADQTTMIALGNRQYRIGASAVMTLTERENMVLQAFVGDGKTCPALESMNLATLTKRSGLEDAPKVLASLRTKYNKVFAPAIRLPKGKGKGGYGVRIVRA